MLSIMAFARPQYENYIVDLAGEALIGQPDAKRELWDRSLDMDDVIDNWRLAHAYPLNTFQMTLRNRASRVDPGAVVAQRSKRRSSIREKLERMSTLKLSEVQD